MIFYVRDVSTPYADMCSQLQTHSQCVTTCEPVPRNNKVQTDYVHLNRQHDITQQHISLRIGSSARLCLLWPHTRGYVDLVTVHLTLPEGPGTHLPEPNALRELHFAQLTAPVERLIPKHVNVDGNENLLQPGLPEAVRTYLLQLLGKVNVPKLFTAEEGRVLQLPQSRGEPHALDLAPLKCPVS